MPSSITSKQCRAARSLLKWNIPDLSEKSGLRSDRIEKFERNIIRLMHPEYKELIKTLEGNDIEFKANFEVHLKKKKPILSGTNTKVYHADGTDTPLSAEEQDKKQKKEEEEAQS